MDVLAPIGRPTEAMSAASAYKEKWPGAEIDLESILGAVIGAESDGAAVRELKKLLSKLPKKQLRQLPYWKKKNQLTQQSLSKMKRKRKR